MFKTLMAVLTHSFKRATSQRGNGESQESRRFSGEESNRGRWTFMGVFTAMTLSLYIVAGLGYYTKVHVWDDMSAEQKTAITTAMASNAQGF